MVVIGWVVAAGVAGREASVPAEVRTEAPATTAAPILDELLAAEADIDHSAVREDTIPTFDVEQTIRRPETTTTTVPGPPPPPTYEGVESCNGPRSLRVRVQGADGEAISGQVSADFKRNGQKVNSAGEPIPAEQYSVSYWLTGQDGVKDLCLDGVPDAQVFFEIYPKDFVEGAFAQRSSRYGSAMWHGVWPGPGQRVNISVPVACAPGGTKGATGTINVEANVDGATVPIRRLVAWSRAGATSNRTPGFSVADAEQYGTPEVKRLEQVASDQGYLLQVQTADDRLVTLEGVPVESCKDTNVTVAVSSKDCEMKVNDGDAQKCSLPKKPVG